MTTAANDAQVVLRVRHLLPFATPFLFGACSYFAIAAPYLFTAHSFLAVAAAFFACVIGTALLAPFAAEAESVDRLRKLAVAVTPVLLTSGAFLFLTLVDSGVIRFITVTGVMLLLALFYGQLDAGDDARFSALSRSVRAVALFFLLAFSFGIGRYVSVPLTGLTALAAVVFAFSAQQDLHGMLDGKAAFGHAAVIGLLDAQLYLAFSFLPTPYMTNAAALLVCTELVSTAMRSALAGPSGRLVPVRHLAIAIVLLAAVLGTAAWV